jgi:hypothetical protein
VSKRRVSDEVGDLILSLIRACDSKCRFDDSLRVINCKLVALASKVVRYVISICCQPAFYVSQTNAEHRNVLVLRTAAVFFLTK